MTADVDTTVIIFPRHLIIPTFVEAGTSIYVWWTAVREKEPVIHTHAYKLKALLTEVGLWESVTVDTNTCGKVHFGGTVIISIVFLEFEIEYHIPECEIIV